MVNNDNKIYYLLNVDSFRMNILDAFMRSSVSCAMLPINDSSSASSTWGQAFTCNKKLLVNWSFQLVNRDKSTVPPASHDISLTPVTFIKMKYIKHRRDTHQRQNIILSNESSFISHSKTLKIYLSQDEDFLLFFRAQKSPKSIFGNQKLSLFLFLSSFLPFFEWETVYLVPILFLSTQKHKHDPVRILRWNENIYTICVGSALTKHLDWHTRINIEKR